MEKLTYTTLGSLGEDFHQAFDAALAYEHKRLGRPHPLVIRGQKKKGQGILRDTNPARLDQLLGEFTQAGRSETRLAIEAARAAIPTWQEQRWPQRVAYLRKAADLMRERQYRLAALLALETGKNRFEAITEVCESIDLILYYCQQMETRQGFTTVMGGNGSERTRTVLRPHGVWAVVAPFNFPLALSIGMATGALLGGNTVVFKPASDTPLTGWLLSEILHECGLPMGIFNLLIGPGSIVGAELAAAGGVDGMVFTGSKTVGLDLLRRFSAERLRPCLAEMGGKNPAIIMPSASLEDAAEGVLRSAFGFGGQKCSACSRLYLHEKIYKPFLELLVAKTKNIAIGDPLLRTTFLGPLINEKAVATYEATIKLGRKDGKIVCGGSRLKGELAGGCFVEPTIVEKAGKASRLFSEEFFAPVLAVAEVKSLAEAITLANATEYGLTAGIFTKEEHEAETFFAAIEAGTTYWNRRGGATTGAWPGVQSFGGWKHSGSSGKSALGPWYVPQFMREQSQTRCS